MNRKYIILIILVIFCFGWIHAQSDDGDEFEKLRSAINTDKDQKQESTESQQPSTVVQTSRMPKDPINIVRNFFRSLGKNKGLVNLIFIITIFVVIIILLIVQFSLRKQVHNIQDVHEKKYRLRTSNLIKSVEQQNKELVRLRKIERTYTILKTSNDDLRKKTAKSILLQHAIKFINHGVVLTDMNGRIIFTNQAFEKMHDYTVRKARNTDYEFYIHYNRTKHTRLTRRRNACF